MIAVIRNVLSALGLGTWRRRFLALGIGFVSFVVFSVGAVEVTSTASFCNSCHIMEPYYASWKKSAHKDVQCIKCHIEPGVQNLVVAKFNGLGQVVDDVLHRTSMKPSTSVGQFACLRSGCHNPEKVRRFEKTSGKFLFKHDKHLDLEYKGMTLACSACHSHVQGDQHFEVNTNVCVTCHLVKSDGHGPVATAGDATRATIRFDVRSGADVLAEQAAQTSGPSEKPKKIPPTDCSTCHNPPAGTLIRGELKINHADYLAYGAKCESCHRNATEIPVPIESGQCLRCHTFGLEKVQSADEAHRVHLMGKHKIECFDCHGTVHHGPSAQQAKLDTLDCQRCHTDQHLIQRTTYLHSKVDGTPPDATPSPPSDPHTQKPGTEANPMFLAHVDCKGCHVKERPVSVKPDSGARVSAASAEGCDRCHKPGFGEKMIPLWQKSTHELWDQVASDLKAKQSLPNADPAAVEQVRQVLTQVKVDGSWGVHNPRYTQHLLETARKTLSDMSNGKPAAKPATTPETKPGGPP